MIQVIAGAGFLPTQSFVLHTDGTAGAAAQDDVTIVSSASHSIHLSVAAGTVAAVLLHLLSRYSAFPINRSK